MFTTRRHEPSNCNGLYIWRNRAANYAYRLQYNEKTDTIANGFKLGSQELALNDADANHSRSLRRIAHGFGDGAGP
jgi:hypothetical protein